MKMKQYFLFLVCLTSNRAFTMNNDGSQTQEECEARRQEIDKQRAETQKVRKSALFQKLLASLGEPNKPDEFLQDELFRDLQKYCSNK